MGQWKGQDVPLVRPSSFIVKGSIPSSQRYLPTYLQVKTTQQHSSKGLRAFFLGLFPILQPCVFVDRYCASVS